jgi:hypothetical protein
MKKILDGQPTLFTKVQYGLNIATWIDNCRFACLWAADDRTIALQWSDRKTFYNHGNLRLN